MAAFIFLAIMAMTVKELQLLVKEGEHTTLEFKRKVAHPEKIVKEIVAFANTKGGNLLIGVNDDGNITGLKYPDEEDYLLEKAISKQCRPKIMYDKEYISISDKKTIIRYYIHESSKKPHFVLEPEVPALEQKNLSRQKTTAEKPPLQKKTYFRVGERSIQASRELREILRRQQSPKDIQFIWGEKEQKLIQYLQENPTITVFEFTRLAEINRYQASRTLVLLVLGNVLRIVPAERGDLYSLKESFD